VSKMITLSLITTLRFAYDLLKLLILSLHSKTKTPAICWGWYWWLMDALYLINSGLTRPKL